MHVITDHQRKKIKLKSLHQLHLPLLSVSSSWHLRIFLDCTFLSPILTASLFRRWLQSCWAYPKRYAGASRRLVQLSETVTSDCWARLGVVNLPKKWTRVEPWVNNCLKQNCHHKWGCPRMNLNDGAVNRMGVNGSFTSKFSINLLSGFRPWSFIVGKPPFSTLKTCCDVQYTSPGWVLVWRRHFN